MKKRISPDLAGLIFAFIHMSNEIVCFFWLFTRFAQRDDFWTWALLYDALAFIPQALWGGLTDRHRELDICTPGLAMLGLGLIIPYAIPSLLLITGGNSMIHVAGAQSTIRGTGGRLGPSGVFVGGGSFGVIAGQLLAAYMPQKGTAVCALFLAVSALLSLYVRRSDNRTLPAEGFRHASALAEGLVAVLAFVTVAARSYAGVAIPTGWNDTIFKKVLLFASMGLGKAAGGYVADRFGARRTAVWSLAICLPFVLFGNESMVVSLIGVALFSMTMSVSLGILVSKFPDNPGICFGITTVGLFIGSMPFFILGAGNLTSRVASTAVLTILTIICFLLCGSNFNKGETK